MFNIGVIMKLEVGQVARLKSGYICKIININDFREPNMKYGVETNYLKDVMFIGDDDVVKASYNIIDILEKGDYVNGNPVCLIKEDEYNRKWIYTDSNYKYGYLEEDIKSILTHEQMEQMAYKVGE